MCIFCNKCGVENSVDAVYCQECGNELIKYSHDELNMENIDTTKKPLTEKSPLGAAVLNLLIAGIGFVYIREYSKAILSFIIVFMAGFISGLLGISVLLGIFALVFVMVWSYNETKKYNNNLDLS